MCAEIWIYMGLAWLSLFFSWNVHMAVQAHKALKKRRHKRHRSPLDECLQPERGEDLVDTPRPTVVDIFKFLSEEGEDYSTVIMKIGEEGRGRLLLQRGPSRSKSCNDLLGNIEVLERSPKHRRRLSEVFINAKDAEKDAVSLADDGESEALLGGRAAEDVAVVLGSCDEDHVSAPQETTVRRPASDGETRFTVCVVAEGPSIRDTDDDKG